MKGSGMMRALGSMSGTSLDGVDAAVIETDGVTIAGFGETGYRAYTADERREIRRAFGQWPGMARVEAAATVVERAHIELLSGFDGVDLVNSALGATDVTVHRGRGLVSEKRNGEQCTGAAVTTRDRAGGLGAPKHTEPYQQVQRRIHFAFAKHERIVSQSP